jgi:hypothetical protein
MEPAKQDHLPAEWNVLRGAIERVDGGDLRFLAVVPMTVFVWLLFWYVFSRTGE